MKINRRRFLAAASATGLFQIVPPHVLGGPRHVPPSERVGLAPIGLGIQGPGDVRNCGMGKRVVAVCDVDHKYAARHINRWPVPKYKDYRRMLEKQKDIDAVLIATPDHTHAVIAMAAMQLGIHVFCEKPLTHDIYEARMLAEQAKRSKVVTQMGIQGHSKESHKLFCEWIAAGAVGDVKKVDAYCSLSYAPHGHTWWSSPMNKRPTKSMPVPKDLDWDCWIGPAPMRPYHKTYHPKVWRCWWDFGSGMMGDRGAHTFDPIVSALKLGPPLSVEGSGIVGGNDEVHPDKAKVVFKFGARGDMPPVTVNWYEGQKCPRPEALKPGRRLPREGGVFVHGEKGTMMIGWQSDNARLIPETAMKEFKRPKKTLPRVRGGHYVEFINAIKEDKTCGADFSFSGPLTETALLGNLAKRFPGKELKWDSKNLKVTNHDEANEWVKRPYRKGWSL
jgi:predicted dehydrogenase